MQDDDNRRGMDVGVLILILASPPRHCQDGVMVMAIDNGNGQQAMIRVDKGKGKGKGKQCHGRSTLHIGFATCLSICVMIELMICACMLFWMAFEKVPL